MKSKKRLKITEMNEGAVDLEDINLNKVTDSEEEYSENERELLRKVRDKESSDSCDSDYEVYGLQQDNESDQTDTETHDEAQTDSLESDIEGLQENFDLPNEKAWGKKKKAYYSTDYVDPDYATINEKDLAVAEMEEEEARNIQKRLAEQLDDVDFGLDFIPSKESNNQEEYEEVEQFIKTDFSKLSKRQKQTIVQKESPEFAALVKDFKDRMTEARDSVAPFLTLVKNNALPYCPAVSFLKTKYQLLLNYCVNITFYLMLKAKRLPVSSHPVIKRLAQYRELLNRLESEQGNLIEKIQEILKAVKERKLLYSTSRANVNERKSSRFKDEANEITSVDSKSETGNDKFIDEIGNNVENTNAKALSTENEGKRAITYQIAKNKGLTPCRKKEQRNPRVKHRNKYRKAKIRRKGAVRAVRKEVTRYAGEVSGIKAGVKKSIKLK
ncbi:unnamed protein product [Xylocopa violacea]|uniref:Sas10 C-terminal domain-containing protein n=1 Tax=Xylocopa violacea TaxID=135666 RepID=A0ABP1PJA6_XYLVO